MERVTSLNRQYLRMVVEQENEQGMEGYRGRILQQNRIEGLLEMSRRYMDDICYYYYDVTGMSSLENLLQQETLTDERLNQLFEMLEETLQHMDAYLMKQEDLCLRPECIMEKEETGEWFFLYFPEYRGKQSEDMEHLGEFMLQHLSCLEEATVQQIYECYSHIVQVGEELSVRELAKFWNKETVKEEEKDMIRYMEENFITEKQLPMMCADRPEPYTADREPYAAGLNLRRRIYQVPYRAEDLPVNENGH